MSNITIAQNTKSYPIAQKKATIPYDPKTIASHAKTQYEKRVRLREEEEIRARDKAVQDFIEKLRAKFKIEAKASDIIVGRKEEGQHDVWMILLEGITIDNVTGNYCKTYLGCVQGAYDPGRIIYCPEGSENRLLGHHFKKVVSNIEEVGEYLSEHSKEGG